MSETANVARKMEQTGEGMKIHISETSKTLLDKVGGFRCDYRGSLDIGVSKNHHFQQFSYSYFLNLSLVARWTHSG
jgi:hypothetical protein